MVAQGDDHILSKSHVEYRRIPQTDFGDFTFYVYGSKTAIILFEENEIEIFIINNSKISNHYRKAFNEMWGKADTV